MAILADSLGIFGGKHIYGYDNEASFMAATVFSNLDEAKCDSGCSFLFNAGVFMQIVASSIAYFLRLQYHRGTPPVYYKGSPPPHLYRLLAIAYPGRLIMEGHTILPFAECLESKCCV